MLPLSAVGIPRLQAWEDVKIAAASAASLWRSAKVPAGAKISIMGISGSPRGQSMVMTMRKRALPAIILA